MTRLGEVLFQGNIALTVSITPSPDEAFQGVPFDEILAQRLESVDLENNVGRSINEHNDLSAVTRDYDFAHEKSEAIDNFFDNMMFIIDEINDPNDKKIEHPMFGTIEDWSTMGGLMQLNVAMQLMNTMYNTAEGLPELGLKIERKLSGGMSG